MNERLVLQHSLLLILYPLEYSIVFYSSDMSHLQNRMVSDTLLKHSEREGVFFLSLVMNGDDLLTKYTLDTPLGPSNFKFPFHSILELLAADPECSLVPEAMFLQPHIS